MNGAAGSRRIGKIRFPKCSSEIGADYLRECLPVLAPDVCEIFGDRCHATYEFQARKPEPVVFERLLARCNVPASAAVFIDDDMEYIEGAMTAGLRAIHYQGLPQLRTALRELHLPV